MFFEVVPICSCAIVVCLKEHCLIIYLWCMHQLQAAELLADYVQVWCGDLCICYECYKLL